MGGDDDLDHNSPMRQLIDAWYDDWFAMDRMYYEWARERGITGNILFTLYAIDVIGKACTPSQIVDKLALSKQTVNSTLDTLEARGLIARQRDTVDQRSRIVSLTEAGRAYAEALLGELDAAERAVFSEMGDDARTLVARARQLVQAMRRAFAAQKADD